MRHKLPCGIAPHHGGGYTRNYIAWKAATFGFSSATGSIFATVQCWSESVALSAEEGDLGRLYGEREAAGMCRIRKPAAREMPQAPRARRLDFANLASKVIMTLRYTMPSLCSGTWIKNVE